MTNDEFFDIGRVAYITGNVQEALAAKQALEAVVKNANSLQQLKAEIAALVNLFPATIPIDGCHTALVGLVSKLRQLSAV
jgi:hypothetical protein